jgi:phage N-6-adenine-methyltransferase
MSIENQSSTTPKSEKDCAQTPIWFMNSLLNLTSSSCFLLDVCANKATAKSFAYYSLEEKGQNALELAWSKNSFCNPPFSNIMPFIEKAEYEATTGNTTTMLLPNNPETAYIRKVKEVADTIIEMPFRLKFLRPNGEPFLDKKGKEQGPKFSCLIAIITPLGLHAPKRSMYYDFREGFYKVGAK